MSIPAPAARDPRRRPGPLRRSAGVGHPGAHHAARPDRDRSGAVRRRRRAPGRRSRPAIAPYAIHLRGTGTFRPVTEVVFVAVAAGISECERLADAVRSGPLEPGAALPVPPARHGRARRADRGARPGLRRAGRLRDRSSTVDHFTFYVHGADGRWRPLRDFPLGAAKRHRPRRFGDDSIVWIVDWPVAPGTRASPRPGNGPGYFDHFWRARERYNEELGGRLAAAIAYYAFFAVFALGLVAYSVDRLRARVEPEGGRRGQQLPASRTSRS